MTEGSAKYGDLLFGHIALSKSFIDAGRLQEGLSGQEHYRRLGFPMPLGEVLKSMGYLDDVQLTEILKLQQSSRKVWNDYYFGRIALRNGLATEAQVAVCVELQKEPGHQGIPLGLLLLDRGYITAQQHEAILRTQERIKERHAGHLMPLHAHPRSFEELALREGILDIPGIQATRGYLEASKAQGRELDFPAAALAAGEISPDDAAHLQDLRAGRIPRGLVPGITIGRKIAQGHTGLLFQAHHEGADCEVAIKFYLPRRGLSRERLLAFLEDVKRCQAAPAPQLVRALAVGEAAGLPYVAMEFLRGDDLDAILRVRGAVPHREATEIVLQVARGIVHLETLGLTHNGVAPGNIIIKDDGLAALGLITPRPEGSAEDLALAQAVSETPTYVSPEQALGAGQIDIRSDIYGLGASWYHLITGVKPFHAETPIRLMAERVTSDPPAPCSLKPDLPKAVEKLVLQLMARNPDHRPRTAKMMVQMIEDLRRPEQTRRRHKDGPPPPKSRRR